MGTFLRYEDTPVWIGGTGEATITATATYASGLLVSNAQVAISTAVEPHRILGKKVLGQGFRVNGPIQKKISLTFFPFSSGGHTGSWRLLQEFTGQYNAGFPVKIGNTTFSGCYLDGYTLSFVPYQPISVNANLTCFQTGGYAPLAAETQPTQPSPNPSTLFYMIDSTVVTDGAYTQVNDLQQVDYSVACSRTPIFALGQAFPSQMLLTTVEKEVSVQGENVGNMISFTGANMSGASSFTMKDLNGTAAPISFSINGQIVSQNLTQTEGGFLKGTASIRENVL